MLISRQRASSRTSQYNHQSFHHKTTWNTTETLETAIYSDISTGTDTIRNYDINGMQRKYLGNHATKITYTLYPRKNSDTDHHIWTLIHTFHHCKYKSLGIMNQGIKICTTSKTITRVSIYLDLTKAFDKVNHRLFIDKLNSFGITGKLLLWFSSYLCYRSIEHVLLKSETQVRCNFFPLQESFKGPT